MNKAKGITYGILSSATFGLIPLLALPALNAGIGINSVLFYRFGLSAFFLGIVLLIKRHNMGINKKQFGTVCVLGVLYGLTAILLTSSYLYIPSGIATTIHFLYPVVVTCTMILFFKEKINKKIILAVAMALAGVYMLAGGSEGAAINPKGIMLALITVFTYAFYIVGVNKTSVSSMNGLTLTFYVLLVGSIVFALNLMLRGEPLETEMDWNVALHLLLLALVPTVVSDLTLILAVQNVGSTTTAVLGCMEPLTAVAIGVMVFNEKIGWLQVVGIGVILTAVTLVILSNRNKN